MGKMVRFDTAQDIRDAASRAKARQRHAIAKLDQRSADMATAYDARQRRQRHKMRQSAKPIRRLRANGMGWNPSGVTIFNIGMVAFVAFWLLPDYIGYPANTASLFAPATTSTDAESARFSFCHSGGGTNCVVDGDTIWYRGNNIRIADIDTPETHPPGCAEEARLGKAATDRLQELLNTGAFSIERIDRDTDPYGRQLRILTRGGESIGGMLVDDGLARWYAGGRRPWC